jgi:hypothetical protein
MMKEGVALLEDVEVEMPARPKGFLQRHMNTIISITLIFVS